MPSNTFILSKYEVPEAEHVTWSCIFQGFFNGVTGSRSGFLVYGEFPQGKH